MVDVVRPLGPVEPLPMGPSDVDQGRHESMESGRTVAGASRPGPQSSVAEATRPGETKPVATDSVSSFYPTRHSTTKRPTDMPPEIWWNLSKAQRNKILQQRAQAASASPPDGDGATLGLC